MINRIALQTLSYRECKRFLRIWPQTLLPPSITITLYFVIFGHLIGPRIGDMAGFSYVQYIAPGLIMMAVISNSYANTVSSFFSSKFQKNIEEMLISPMSNMTILTGFVLGGALRGLCVGALVTVLTLFFTQLHVQHSILTFCVILLSAILFSLAGFTNAIFAKKFDDISIVPTFVLTPLTYLGGVFYSIHLLPPFWQTVSQFNPILYLVNAFRYGVLGISDINISFAFSMIVLSCVLLFCFNLYLLAKGTGLRS